MRRAAARSSADGETGGDDGDMPVVRWMVATSASRADVLAAILRRNRDRCSRPARRVSPSSRIGEPPRVNNWRSSARANVDFPEPGNPVSQITAPLWRCRADRSSVRSADSTGTMSTGTAR